MTNIYINEIKIKNKEISASLGEIKAHKPRVSDQHKPCAYTPPLTAGLAYVHRMWLRLCTAQSRQRCSLHMHERSDVTSDKENIV